MKNKLSKLYKIFLAVGMVFSMCFNTLGMSVVNAYDPSVPKEFTRVKNIFIIQIVKIQNAKILIY